MNIRCLQCSLAPKHTVFGESVNDDYEHKPMTWRVGETTATFLMHASTTIFSEPHFGTGGDPVVGVTRDL